MESCSNYKNLDPLSERWYKYHKGKETLKIWILYLMLRNIDCNPQEGFHLTTF